MDYYCTNCKKKCTYLNWIEVGEAQKIKCKSGMWCKKCTDKVLEPLLEKYRATLREEIIVEQEKKDKRSLTTRLRFQLLKRDSYKCQICGRDAKDGVKLEIGHKRAHSKNGKTIATNLATLCFECNRGMRTDDF